ncbi:MAG: TetR/AcrR family transcriptional regulator [Hyphomonadaceae bacterium]|nr:TetR/AcrR family transcriptional regulator [Hyphomonadaceae bacterium]
MKRAQVTPERPGWLAKLPDPWDEKVLSAAFDAFAAKGFDGASMAEIATLAGVSKRTVYERYKDKAHLFRALLAWGCRGNLPLEPPSTDLDAEEALVRQAEAVLAAMMRPESIDLARIVIAATPRFPELGALFDDMTRTASLRIVKALARRLARDGRIATANADQVAADFIGLLRGDAYYRALLGVAPVLPQPKVKVEARRAVKTLLAAYGG